MTDIFRNMAKPKSTKVVRNIRLKQLLAKLNQQHDFKFCFENERVVNDLRAYVSKNLTPKEPASQGTLMPSEAVMRVAKRAADAVAKVQKRKAQEEEDRLAKCDAEADERQTASERINEIVGLFRITV